MRMSMQVATSAMHATTTLRIQMSQEVQRIGTLTNMQLRTVPVLCGVSIEGVSPAWYCTSRYLVLSSHTRCA